VLFGMKVCADEVAAANSANYICIVLQSLDIARWKQVMVAVINHALTVVIITIVGIIIIIHLIMNVFV